jgi:hypothetical protein
MVPARGLRRMIPYPLAASLGYASRRVTTTPASRGARGRHRLVIMRPLHGALRPQLILRR